MPRGDDNGGEGAATPPPEPGFVIRRLMRQRGLTERRLAEAVGVRIEIINRIVCGRSRLTPRMARAIALELDVRPEVLLDAQRDWDLWLLRNEPLPKQRVRLSTAARNKRRTSPPAGASEAAHVP